MEEDWEEENETKLPQVELKDRVIWMLDQIKKHYIENNNITIYYYCQPVYFEQLQEFVQSSKIILCDIKNKPPKSIQLWIETPTFNFKFNQLLFHSKNPYFKNMKNNLVFYNKFYKIFFNKVLNTINFPIQLQKFYY